MSCENHWEENVSSADGNKWQPILNVSEDKEKQKTWSQNSKTDSYLLIKKTSRIGQYYILVIF